MSEHTAERAATWWDLAPGLLTIGICIAALALFAGVWRWKP